MYTVITIGIRLATIALLLVLSGCSSLLCSDDILVEVKSPDGNFIAYLFERNCGATTPYMRIVSIRSAHRKFDAEVTGDWVFKITGQPKVTISWLDSKHLSISNDGSGEAAMRIESWNEIKVTYP